MLKKIVMALLGLVILVAVALLGVLAWASSQTHKKLAQRFEAHSYEFPIPPPLSEADLEELRAQEAAKRAASASTDAMASATPEGAAAAADVAAALAPPPAEDLLAGLDLSAIATERSAARGKHLVESR